MAISLARRSRSGIVPNIEAFVRSALQGHWVEDKTSVSRWRPPESTKWQCGRTRWPFQITEVPLSECGHRRGGSFPFPWHIGDESELLCCVPPRRYLFERGHIPDSENSPSLLHTSSTRPTMMSLHTCTLNAEIYQPLKWRWRFWDMKPLCSFFKSRIILSWFFSFPFPDLHNTSHHIIGSPFLLCFRVRNHSVSTGRCFLSCFLTKCLKNVFCTLRSFSVEEGADFWAL